MSLKQEIQPYIDGNGLVAPNPVPEGVARGSDNGPMFTSEYALMRAAQSGECLSPNARYEFTMPINRCINPEGMLCRAPWFQPTNQCQVDDYYAVLNACKAFGITYIPQTFLAAVWKYKGALNTVNPGVWTGNSFLIRQPQLLCAMITAAYPTFRPKDLLIRLASFPLYLYTALVILFSNAFTTPNDSNSWRLAWHLIKTVEKSSILCALASKLWWRRLYKAWGPSGMRAVAGVYYLPQDDNPFSKYWPI